MSMVPARSLPRIVDVRALPGIDYLLAVEERTSCSLPPDGMAAVVQKTGFVAQRANRKLQSIFHPPVMSVCSLLHSYVQ